MTFQARVLTLTSTSSATFHDDVINKILRNELRCGVILELGKGGDNACVICQILRNQNVHIYGGANITVQPTRAR